MIVVRQENDNRDLTPETCAGSRAIAKNRLRRREGLRCPGKAGLDLHRGKRSSGVLPATRSSITPTWATRAAVTTYVCEPGPMPKSKNRRKPRSSQTGSATGSTRSAVSTEVAEEGSSSRRTSERAEAVPSKRKSVGPVEFFRQVRAEAMKVTWTTRGETTVSTIMVLIMVAIMSVFFFSVDQVLRFVIPRILSLNLF